MKNYLTILLIFFCIITGQSQSIEGRVLVCTENCIDYVISDGLGGPYLWSSDIGKMDSNKGAEVNVCWDSRGTGELSVLDLSGASGAQKTTIQVEVINPPIAKVYFPEFPICTQLDTLQEQPNSDFTIFKCQKVCAGSTVSYFVEGVQNDSTYVRWTVEGGTTAYYESGNGNDGNEITVTWGDGDFGSINVEVTNIAGCTDVETYCIEILDNPDVTISSSAIGPLCAGQNVTLQATSDNAVSYKWSIDDVSYGDQSSAQFSFDNAGTYNVQLLSNTECLCADTLSYVIEVISVPGPEIDCISTSHINVPQTYFATEECDSYQWAIGPQGIIVEGGGVDDNFIVVTWTDGPYGEISLSNTGCDNPICPQTTTEYVPIIIPNLEINGEEEACNDGQSTYSLPLYPGTTYNWSISGNGQIVDGQGTNEIAVQWNSVPYIDQDAVLTVTYENCLLQCDGTVTKNITLKSKYELSGYEKIVCQNNSVEFYSLAGYSSVNGDWELYDSEGVLLESNNGASSWRIDAIYVPGFYEVRLIDLSGDYCNELAVVYFEILKRPDPVTEIAGPLTVCKNERYVYSSDASLTSNAIIKWSFDDGGAVSQFESNTVVFTWLSDGPYSITAIVEDDRRCESDAFTLNLQTAQTASIIGDSDLCLHDTGSYEVDNNTTDVTWTVSPADAGTVYTTEEGIAEITWHLSGSHTVSVDFCSVGLSYNVDVIAGPEFTVTYDNELCVGDLTTVNVSTTASVSTIEILDVDDNVVGSGTDIGPGYFYVELTDASGCTAKEQIGIDSLAPPVVSLTTPDFEYFCQPAADRVLHAPDSEEGYSYEWYRDNTLIANTASTLSTSDYGTYQVEVTDIRGCKTLSNNLYLVESCAVDTLFNSTFCNSLDTVGFEADNLPFCNEFQFTNVSSPGHDPSTIQYQFYDPVIGFTTFSRDENPLHIFSAPGYYKIVMRANVPDIDNPGSFCSDYFIDVVEVPIAASFHVVKNCVNEPMAFKSTSTFLPGKNIIAYEWDFGDPASGIDNISNIEDPNHTFTTTGTYLVKLTIVSDDGCRSRVIEEITVNPNANVDFVLPRNLCAGEALKFVTPAGSNLSEVVWTFDDPNATAAQNNVESDIAIHFFSDPGTYDVTLEANNIYGCSSIITKSVTVDNNTQTGEIVVSNTSPICEGESVTLTAPTGIAYIWSSGETTASIEALEQGVYRVTVTGSDACNYVPEEVVVEVIPRPHFAVIAYTYPEGYIYEGLPHYEAIELCKGEQFELSTRWSSGWTYSWNILSATGRFVSYSNLSSLVGGTYDVIVTISDPSSGCSFDSDPFSLTIHDVPDPVTIVSDQPDMCEGKPFVLSVSNPLPGIRYYWNNGQVGEQITLSNAGNYYVTAVNEFGCERGSNWIFINPLPNVDLLPQGCQEVCFPFDLCLPALNFGSTYELFLNGTSLGSPSANTTMTITESGDYQILVTSGQGCKNTSDVLTLFPEQLNHSAIGTVFIDENKNEIFDGTDMLVENANVILRIGNVEIASTLTNAQGEFSFTGINHRNVILEIEASSLDFTVPADQLIIFIEFETCEDNDLCNFPLNTDCTPSNELLELQVCAGQDGEYEGILYPPGHMETFTYQSIGGCDSVVVLSVVGDILPNVSVLPTPSCFGQDNGSLEIDLATATGLLFSLDNTLPFTSDLLYDNLSPGTFSLYVINEVGCEFEFPQVITESPEVVVGLDISPACEGLDNGVLELIVDPSLSYLYSLDGGAITSDLVYSNLATGNHELLVIDNDCEYIYAFDIIEKQGAQLSVMVTETCSGANNGKVELVSNIATGLTMTLDNGTTVSDQFNFDNLSAGAHTLLVESGSGCAQEISFTIENEATPLLSFSSFKTCFGVATGQIVVDDLGPGFAYTIDSGSFGPDLEYDDLSEGDYMLQVESNIGCIYDYNVAIESHPDVTVQLSAEVSCPGQGNGMVVLEDANSDLSLSLDDVTYITDDVIENLTQGTYQVYVKDENDCVKEISIQVEEATQLELNFDEYSTDCSVESILIEPTVISSAGDIEYNWNTGESTPTIVVDQSSAYTVEISDKCSTETYEWDLEFVETELAEIYMPNIISSRAVDVINQSFKPQYNSDVIVEDFNMKVYDRWGNLISDSKNASEGWDGYINGKKADTGVYLWSYEMNVEECGEIRTIKQVGDVTIIN